MLCVIQACRIPEDKITRAHCHADEGFDAGEGNDEGEGFDVSEGFDSGKNTPLHVQQLQGSSRDATDHRESDDRDATDHRESADKGKDEEIISSQ